MGATAEQFAAWRRNIEAPEPWAEEALRSIVTPISWTVHGDPFLHFRKLGDTLLVLWSARREKDGRRWVHVSCSRPSRLPSWEDMREVKDAFIGRDRKAIQVFPPQAEYVNIAEHALHLWHCLDEDVLPDFRREGQI